MIYNTVAELLADESRWTKGAFTRDSNDHTLTTFKNVEEAVNSVEACKWCLFGALMKIYKIGSKEYFNATEKILDVIKGDLGFVSSTFIITFNDTKTHAEVIEVVRKAGV